MRKGRVRASRPRSMRVEGRQLSIASQVIKPVTDDVHIGYLKTTVRYFYIGNSARGTVEQRADRKRRRLTRPKRLHDVLQRESRVDRVVHEKNMPTLNGC